MIDLFVLLHILLLGGVASVTLCTPIVQHWIYEIIEKRLSEKNFVVLMYAYHTIPLKIIGVILIERALYAFVLLSIPDKFLLCMTVIAVVELLTKSVKQEYAIPQCEDGGDESTSQDLFFKEKLWYYFFLLCISLHVIPASELDFVTTTFICAVPLLVHWTIIAIYTSIAAVPLLGLGSIVLKAHISKLPTQIQIYGWNCPISRDQLIRGIDTVIDTLKRFGSTQEVKSFASKPYLERIITTIIMITAVYFFASPPWSMTILLLLYLVGHASILNYLISSPAGDSTSSGLYGRASNTKLKPASKFVLPKDEPLSMEQKTKWLQYIAAVDSEPTEKNANTDSTLRRRKRLVPDPNLQTASLSTILDIEAVCDTDRCHEELAKKSASPTTTTTPGKQKRTVPNCNPIGLNLCHYYLDQETVCDVDEKGCSTQHAEIPFIKTTSVNGLESDTTPIDPLDTNEKKENADALTDEVCESGDATENSSIDSMSSTLDLLNELINTTLV